MSTLRIALLHAMAETNTGPLSLINATGIPMGELVDILEEIEMPDLRTISALFAAMGLVPVFSSKLMPDSGAFAPDAPIWKHVERGTVYTEIGRAELQTATPVPEGALLVIYAGEDGRLWARAQGEFDDGRFVALA